MTESKIIPLMEDRSSAEIDDRCGMRYWFYKHEQGTGIVPEKEALALRIGKETHEDLRTIAEMSDISEGAIQEAVDEILAPLQDEDKVFREPMELLYRRLGWLVAWALFIEPKIRADWHDVSVEQEIVLDRGDLWVPTTPDRVLKNKTSGALVYQEYKTTISAGYKWQQSWRYAIQLHIGMAALEEELGQQVAFGRIVGLMKGYKSDDRLHHPYVWGYYNSANQKWSADYRSGADWTPRPVWEYPGGIVEWVKFAGLEIALSQFPHSAPVFLDTRMLEDWVLRRTARQRHIRVVKDRCQVDRKWRALHFERRTNQCRPAFGDQCPYLLPCWNASAEQNPLASGDYIPREPHHELEIIGAE